MTTPQTIDRYVLHHELGRGGMGVVYRAEDPQLGRAVAIKVILFPAQAGAEVRAHLEKRFEREARAAASIRHPGVVTVYDFGRDGDFLYLVMELVDGPSLADRLRTGPRPDRAEATEIVARVAEALAAAHAGGVVHRDVTPRNILLAGDGRILVTDFGLARSFGEETIELTQTGLLVGSPGFTAPELVRHQAFDERADLFSLGVVLFLLLTGRQPFRGSDVTSLLYQIVHEDPLDDELRRSLGPQAVGLLERCLAKAPEERIGSAAELAREVRKLASTAGNPPLEATLDLRPPARVPSARGSLPIAAARRRRPGRRLALALVLLAIAGAAGAWWLAGHRGDALSERPAQIASTTLRVPEPIAAAPTIEASTPSAPEAEPEPAPPTRTAPPPQPEPPPPRSAPPRQSAPPPTPPPPRATVEAAQNVVQRAPEEADTVAPVLSLDPIPAELTDSRIVLSGRVMDDHGEVELTVDGEPVPVLEDGSFSISRPLEPGRNALLVAAADGAGNRTLRSVEVGQTPTAATSEPPQGARQPAAPVRYGDRGDGTMVDLQTGLLWSKRAGDAAPTLKAGRSACKRLELAHRTDWALPTVEELEELHLAGSLQAGQLSFPGLTVWSDTKNGSSKAWAFDFASGLRVSRLTAGGDGDPPQTLCVRRMPRRPPQAADGDARAPGPQGSGGLDGPAGPGRDPRKGGGGPPPPRGGGPGGGGPGGGGGGGGGGQNYWLRALTCPVWPS